MRIICMKEQSYMKLHSFFESLRELRHFLLLISYLTTCFFSVNDTKIVKVLLGTRHPQKSIGKTHSHKELQP